MSLRKGSIIIRKTGDGLSGIEDKYAIIYRKLYIVSILYIGVYVLF